MRLPLSSRSEPSGLAACSSGEGTTEPTAAPTLEAPSGELHIGAFGGTLGQAVLSVVPEFEAKYPDVKVTYEDTNAPQLIGQLIQTRNQEVGSFDLIVMPPAVHLQGVEAGLWQELSPDLVPILGTLPENVVPDGKYATFGSFRARPHGERGGTHGQGPRSPTRGRTSGTRSTRARS